MLEENSIINPMSNIDKEKVDDWYYQSIKDIESSKVLYDNKLYSQAVYYFQQASEKSLKAYAFQSKIYNTEKDARKTGHYTIGIFKSLVNEQEKSINLFNKIGISEMFPFLEYENYSENLKLADSQFPKKDEIIEYSSKQIEEAISLINELKEFPYKFDFNDKKMFRDLLSKWFENIKPHITDEKTKQQMNTEMNTFLEDDSQLENLLLMSNKMINFSMQFVAPIQTLHLCNELTHNHNNFSRYPSIETTPRKYYTLRKPLVKKLPLLLEELLFAIKKLQGMSM